MPVPEKNWRNASCRDALCKFVAGMSAFANTTIHLVAMAVVDGENHKARRRASVLSEQCEGSYPGGRLFEDDSMKIQLKKWRQNNENRSDI